MVMKSFRVIVLFCMLTALCAFANQGSMQPTQTPSASGAASQNPQAQSPNFQTPQNPQAPNPAYSPSQAQPGAEQSPAAQTPQGEPSQAPAMRSNADSQVAALTQQLNLNSDQQAKIKSILEDQHQQVVSLVNDNSMSRDAKLQKVHAIRQQTIDKVRTTLTTDEQKNKFDTMIQAQNERIRQREQQDQQQPK